MIIHHSQVLQSGYEESNRGWYSTVTIIATSMATIQFVHEVIQICHEKQRYFKSLFNIVQISAIMINIACIFFGIFWDQELDGRRERISRSVVAPAFGTFLLFLQLVYWLLLFERTSFYVTLLVQSFLDIIYFLFILLIILLAFAITVFVINKNSFEHHEFNE